MSFHAAPSASPSPGKAAGSTLPWSLLHGLLLGAGWTLLARHGQEPLLWTQTGTALAILHLLGARAAPWLLLTGFGAAACVAPSLQDAAFLAASPVLEGLVGAWALRRGSGFRPQLRRVRDAVHLFARAAPLAACAGAAVWAASACAGLRGDGPGTLSLLPAAWLRSYTSAILWSAPILTWAARAESPPPLALSRAVTLCVTGLACIASSLCFSLPGVAASGHHPSPGELVLFPLLAAVGLGLVGGQRTLSSLVALLSLGAAVASAAGLGPFVGGFESAGVPLSLYLVVAASAGMLLSASSAEGRDARECLLSQERAHGVLLDSVPACIWHTDEAGRIVRMNKAARLAWEEGILPVGPGPGPEGVQLVSGASGKGRWFRRAVVPILLDRESQNGTLSFAIDITEFKVVERQLERAREDADRANSAKSEFLANMSHEIRTPLNGVLGLVDMLLGMPLAAEQREYVELIRSSSEVLLEILNDVLDLSKIESGRLTLERVEFSLRGAVDEAAAIVAERAFSKGVEMVVLVDPEIPPRVLGDPTRLRQVFLNLLSNAIKFTSEGEIVLHARVLSSDEDGMRIEFRVCDTGIGVPPESRALLFDAFSQASPETTRQYGGTGLGLAISKHLVSLMGGSIGYEAPPGRGSIFCFTAKFGHGSRRSSSRRVLKVRGLPCLALVSHASTNESLSKLLSKSGVELDSAHDIGALRALLEEAEADGKRYWVVVVDARFLLEQGADARSLLLASHCCQDAVDLLLTSGAERRSLGDLASQYPIQLAKPIRESQVHRALREALHLVEHPPADLAGRSPGKTPTTPWRILVAEDNKVNQLVVTRILQRNGFRVDVVANGEDAVNAALGESYDAILMDCKMPVLDGYDAAKRIRGEESAGRSVPIIALTADALEGNRERCLAAGMNDYLTKPIRADLLLKVIRSWVAAGGKVPEAEVIQVPAE